MKPAWRVDGRGHVHPCVSYIVEPVHGLSQPLQQTRIRYSCLHQHVQPVAPDPPQRAGPSRIRRDLPPRARAKAAGPLMEPLRAKRTSTPRTSNRPLVWPGAQNPSPHPKVTFNARWSACRPWSPPAWAHARAAVNQSRRTPPTMPRATSFPFQLRRTRAMVDGRAEMGSPRVERRRLACLSAFGPFCGEALLSNELRFVLVEVHLIPLALTLHGPGPRRQKATYNRVLVPAASGKLIFSTSPAPPSRRWPPPPAGRRRTPSVVSPANQLRCLGEIVDHPGGTRPQQRLGRVRAGSHPDPGTLACWAASMSNSWSPR